MSDRCGVCTKNRYTSLLVCCNSAALFLTKTLQHTYSGFVYMCVCYISLCIHTTYTNACSGICCAYILAQRHSFCPECIFLRLAVSPSSSSTSTPPFCLRRNSTHAYNVWFPQCIVCAAPYHNLVALHLLVFVQLCSLSRRCTLFRSVWSPLWRPI